jgi:hypothetical protein
MSEEIKAQANPLGKVIEDSGIETFIKAMAAKWDASRPTARWWQVWKRIPLTAATNFLLDALDQLIAYVDQKISDNVDKKATVMDAISRLYDLIIGSTLPIWLKPFGPAMKNIVMTDIISPAIDWIVSKYRDGSFQPVVQAQLFGVPGGHRP